MSLSYWNTQFQFTKVLPDFQDCLARITQRSEQVALPFRQVPYGTHARQFVEISAASVRGSVLPVFIHGGYWRALTAQMHRFVLPPLAAEFGAVANIEYRLMPEVALGEIVEDALAALDRLAQDTGCTLAVVGHSAGGHLAVMAALKRPDIVSCAVGISGLYDLTPLQWSFLREEVGLSAASIDGHSPLALWDGGAADHILLAVGAHETPEFHRQAQIFASQHGAQTAIIPDTHHMTILDALAAANGPLSTDIHTFIQSAASRRFSANGP